MAHLRDVHLVRRAHLRGRQEDKLEGRYRRLLAYNEVQPLQMTRALKALFLIVLLGYAPYAFALSADEENNSAIYQEAGPSVVNIVTTAVSYDFFYNPVPSTGSGPGVIADSKGHIITNYHVINGARSLAVTLFDGSKYTAEVVGVDPGDDLAVIKIKAPSSTLKPIEFGDSSALQIGQKAFAIG